MKTFNDGGGIGCAAMKAGMDRKTARRYLRRGHGPSTPRRPRHWQTRPDALAAIWPEIVRWLEGAPEIEAKAFFEHLLAQRPGDLPAKALRTFQRRVHRWRTQDGPPKEVFFPQVSDPGVSVQLDWTHAHKLGVTLAGVPLMPCGAAVFQLGMGRAMPVRIGPVAQDRLAGRVLAWSFFSVIVNEGGVQRLHFG